MENNLYRSSDDKVVAGVCGGLAHRFDLNATGLRWAFALATVFFFFTLIPEGIYIALWIILKERQTKGVIDA